MTSSRAFTGKSNSFSQRLFATLIRRTCKYLFNSATFILTKLCSISLTAKYIRNLPRKILPHATFFARPRVTRNTKLDYSKLRAMDMQALGSIASRAEHGTQNIGKVFTSTYKSTTRSWML